MNRAVCINADNFFYLIDHPLWIRGGQIDLVQNGQDFEILLNRRVAIGHALRFNALRRIDDQQGTFAGRQGARYLVGEIDVTRCIDKIEVINLTGLRRVVQRYRLSLDRDATLLLQIHGVENLC